MQLLRPYRALVIATFLVGAGMQVCGIASGALSAYIVGRAITGATASELQLLMLTLILLIVPLVALPWLETVLAHIAAFRILSDLRIQIYDAFERLAPGYLLERRSGDLASAAMADVEYLENGLSHTLPPLLVALVVPLGALAALAMFHWALAVALLPFVLAAATVPLWLRRGDDALARTVRDRMGAVAAEVIDTVQGLREIVTFGAQRQRGDILDERERDLVEAQIGLGTHKGLSLGISELLSGLGMLAVVLVSAGLVSAGLLARPLFPASIVLAAATFAPVALLMSGAREYPTVAAASERIYTILTAPSPVTDRVSAAPAGDIQPIVQFEGVRFQYGPHLPEALAGASFEIAAGETVALVGHSGAGKSTCANLLLRLWDVGGGRIRIGGHDVRAFPQTALRQHIAYVPQDGYLFNRTVRENIRIGRATASDAEIEAAAHLAQATEFIEALPEGWDTVLGERGIRISGGQRQRIAIARALLKDSPILVLDEAVSSLDAESEYAVQQAMNQVRTGRTVLVIAHRLSTIRTADRIVVLDHGRVVEHGRYAELIAAGGAFARLIT
jgi:ABC-type multidrug transport system fused ATPase/permease subunit